MRQIKGVVERAVQCSGCLQVTVIGKKPGRFTIDNCCVWSIVDAEGSNWMGRPVQYVDGYMRFLDRQVKPNSQLRRGSATGQRTLEYRYAANHTETFREKVSAPIPLEPSLCAPRDSLSGETLMNEPIVNEPTKNAPIASKQFDRVQAAIWRQDSQAGESDKPLFTLTLSRSYRDTNGVWQRSYSFTPRDLPHVKLAVEWGMRELLLKEE